MLAVGMHCVFDQPLDAVAGRIERIAALAFDPRWPWVPGRLRLWWVPGMQSDRPRKQRATKESLRGALTATDVDQVGVIRHRNERDNHSWLYVHTGHRIIPGTARYPFEVRAFCRAEWLPEGASIKEWLSVLHALVEAVGAVHGVVVIEDEDVIHDEVWLIVTIRDDVRVNPRWKEIDRISGSGPARHGLGERFVRHPRWGTYLRPEHVAAIGGRERIAEVVQPAELREVGELLYVQLTASPETATSPDALAKQRAFTELVAPILVPPRPA